MKKRLSRYCYITAGGLALIALLLWFVPTAVNSRRSEPLNHPFPLVVGQKGSYSFVTQDANTYYIGIALDRKLPLQRLWEIIGINDKKPVSRPAIKYRLFSHSHVVPTAPSNASWWGRTVGFDLATFSAVRGQQYTLEAAIINAEPDLQVLNARLVVNLAPLPAEGLYTGALLAKLAAALLLVLAIGLGGGGFFCRSRINRESVAVRGQVT